MQQVRRRGRSLSMRMSFLEWAARVAMLVLAGMVTLSILGSIAAISSRPSPGGGTGVAPGDLPPQAAGPIAQASRPPPPSRIEDRSAAHTDPPSGAAVAVAAAPQAGSDPWLEAIAYALLALAGIFAIAVLLLWNALRQLRRIADAAEARGQE